jgi:hypothetical protein
MHGVRELNWRLFRKTRKYTFNPTIENDTCTGEHLSTSASELWSRKAIKWIKDGELNFEGE